MSDPVPSCEIVHAMPGRARLRIEARRGDKAFLASVANGLAAIPGIFEVEVFPLTGSLLIRHGPPLDLVIAAAEKAHLFAIAKAVALAPPPPREWPKLPVDPRTAVAAGLGAIALWQMTEGRFLPPALTLVWYAARLLGLETAGRPSGQDWMGAASASQRFDKVERLPRQIEVGAAEMPIDGER